MTYGGDESRGFVLGVEGGFFQWSGHSFGDEFVCWVGGGINGGLFGKRLLGGLILGVVCLGDGGGLFGG